MSIWSAGCATGEEPYSLAMLFCELGAEPSQVNLLATDINEAAVAFAREGLYDKRRLGGVSSERLARHFSEAGERFAIRPSVKQLVGFDALNLASPLTGRVAPGTLDVILCRNVIIYFDFPTVHKVMDKFFDSLRPGGLLLLGYSESLFTVYDRFEMVEVEGAFIYRRPVAVAPKRGVDEPAPRPRTFVEPGVPAREASEAEYRARGGSPGARVPVKTPPFSLHRAKSAPAPTKRLTPLPRPKSPTGVALKKRLPTQRLAHAVARMTEGDFDETLRTLKALTADEPNDLDALITLGNVYTLLGQQDQARAAFAIALGREPLCLEARIFGGVSALQSGNLAEAVAELTRALFLEPTLAIGHYLLAQAQERGGSHDAARRSYRNALAQLKHAQRPLAGHYPDMLEAPDAIARAARYALAALEENR